VTLRTFTVSVESVLPPTSGFTAETSFGISPGPFADGQSVTITDTQSRFGTKPNGAKPWLYIPNATDLLPDLNFSRGTAANHPNTTNVISTTAPLPTNSAGSVRVDMTSSGNSIRLYKSGLTAVYVFAHRRFGWDVHHDALATNHKPFRLWSGFGGTDPPTTSLFQSYGSQQENRLNPAISMSDVPPGPGGDNVQYSGPSALLDGITTQWHRAEWETKFSSAYGVADGVWGTWVNGSREQYVTNLTNANGAWNILSWGNCFLSQISSSTVNAGSYFYYGPILMDDSRCRIIVSDESSWNTTKNVATTRDFCLPTLWASNSITLTLRQGIHTTLSGKYLYVVKSDGSALKIGRFT
jgi:hypothetical protein